MYLVFYQEKDGGVYKLEQDFYSWKSANASAERFISNGINAWVEKV